MKLGSWPVFGPDEITAATAVLESGRVNYWTGDQCVNFEQELATAFDVAHAVTTTNGTAALELALNALSIGPGDEVIVTPRSYFASVGAVMAVGATPVFADIDPRSQNLTAATLEPVISPRTRAVLLVHLGGWACDVPSIMALADAHGFKVIEDCAQAHGATYAGRYVGSMGHIAAFSFCQDKIITTAGEGGAVVTDDKALRDRVLCLREDGKSVAHLEAPTAGHGFPYIREAIGSNHRMTEVQAAVGRVQLAKLTSWVEARRAHARQYDAELATVSALRTVQPNRSVGHAYYQYFVFMADDVKDVEDHRNRLVQKLRKDGIPCSMGPCPEIYRESPIQDRGLGPARRLPHAQALGETSIALPVYPTLTSSQIEWVCERLRHHLASL